MQCAIIGIFAMHRNKKEQNLLDFITLIFSSNSTNINENKMMLQLREQNNTDNIDKQPNCVTATLKII